MSDITYAVKDKDGNYYAGYDTGGYKWEKQLRKAKLYHSLKYAKHVCMDHRAVEREAFVVKVEISELEEPVS